MALETHIRIANVDRVYAALTALHDGCDPAESARRNARLIMILINQVGDDDKVLDAIAAAAQSPG